MLLKWQVVQDIEKRLPISPYDAEWDSVQRGTNPKLYRPITLSIESWVPWVFFYSI
ncbi:RipA family octameric membrane protein [Vibrio metschnikovii]